MNKKVINLLFTPGAVLFLALRLMMGEAPAQTNAAPPDLPANRYLLIVETSRPMQRRTAGLLQTVQDLLGSTLARQWRKGDTLGLWTFNDDLYAGKFPLQDCSPENNSAVTTRVAGFLRAQKYEKQPNLEKILPQVQRVVQGSRYITVILISTGTDQIHGTPFDDQINQAFKLWRDQQQDARMPLVTILRAKAGQITDYAVNQAPWPVELPPLPAELQADNLVTNMVATPSPSVVPPLVVSGSKLQPKPKLAIALPVTKSAPPTTPASVDVAKGAGPTAPATVPAAAVSALTPGQAPSQNMQAPPPPARKAEVPQPLDARPAVINPPDHAKLNLPQGQSSTVPVQPVTKLADPGASRTAAAPGDRPTASAPATNKTGPAAPVATVAPHPRMFDRTTLLIVGLSALVALSVMIWLVIRARARAPLRISLITESVDRKK